MAMPPCRSFLFLRLGQISNEFVFEYLWVARFGAIYIPPGGIKSRTLTLELQELHQRLPPAVLVVQEIDQPLCFGVERRPLVRRPRVIDSAGQVVQRDVLVALQMVADIWQGVIARLEI